MNVLKNRQSIFLGMVSLAPGCKRNASTCEVRLWHSDMTWFVRCGAETWTQLIEHLCYKRHLARLCGLEVTALPFLSTYSILDKERFKTKFQVERRKIFQAGRTAWAQVGRWASFGELKISLEKVVLVRKFTKARSVCCILAVVERLWES